jgi:hypothetical protein
MRGDIIPGKDCDPRQHHLTVRVTWRGAEVRTGRSGGVELVTAVEAARFAEDVLQVAWCQGNGGGAELTARPLESCVVVTCSGYASGEELEEFARALEAAADLASRWVDPAMEKRKALARRIAAKKRAKLQTA